MNWEEVQEKINKLYGKIDFKPDIVSGVAKGGVIPAVMIAEKLGVKDMYAITVKKHEGKRRVMTKLTEDIAHKKILLVEDAVESGKSMLAAKKYLEGKGAIVKTAALFIKDSSPVKPDYALESFEDSNFPWEEVTE